MTHYYDPIYGKVQVDEAVLSMVSKCPELKRLRFIGMMNFKSFKMLPLTTISRLEHSIGLTILSKILKDNNPILNDLNNDLLVASLFHDVNCGSFGHSVEWAIDRYTPFNHESEVEWVKSEDNLSDLSKKPMFIELDGLHRHGFVERYNLDLERIDNIVEGDGYFYINNRGIDLDNIDNVFRMAHYLGILEDRLIPQKLVRALRVDSDYDNFILKDSNRYLIKEWYKLRSLIYELFIYSSDYMGYEYLIFELISEYSKALDRPEDVKRLIRFTDENLLWTCYGMKQSHPGLSNIAKRLLLNEIPNCYGILRSELNSDLTSLREKEIRQSIANSIRAKISKKGYNVLVHLHMTTDDKKTNRRIKFFSEKDGKRLERYIGNDKQYVLLAILGERDLKPVVSDNLTQIAIGVLEKEGFPGFIQKKETPEVLQRRLF